MVKHFFFVYSKTMRLFLVGLTLGLSALLTSAQQPARIGPDGKPLLNRPILEECKKSKLVLSYKYVFKGVFTRSYRLPCRATSRQISTNPIGVLPDARHRATSRDTKIAVRVNRPQSYLSATCIAK
jgi:hypothetical protein